MQNVQNKRERVPVHALGVRFFHWLNAIAIFIMTMSGWRIYNASPLFGFRFPSQITLGGWLGGALPWHFAAMWLLVVNLAFYLLIGLVSGHFRRAFFPVSLGAVTTDLKKALRGQLSHGVGHYNSVQKTFYIGVVLVILVTIISGLCVWKPVQLQSLVFLLGGYENARLVHFAGMSGIVAFVVVHLALVVVVPSTLIPMITGSAQIDLKIEGVNNHDR